MNILSLIECLSQICPTNNYAAIVLAYFTARLIIVYSKGHSYTDTIRHSAQLHQALKQEKLAIADTQVNAYGTLCSEITNIDMYLFFENCTPGMIADTKSFKSSTKGMRESTILKLLHAALQIGPGVNDAILPNTPQCNDLVASYPVFPDIWYSVHYLPLSPLVYEHDGHVTEAYHFYSSNYWNKTDLLDDYSHVYFSDSLCSFQTATRGHRRRSISSAMPESGKSDDDRHLIELLKKMSAILPHRVIDQLFFSSDRNDLICELSVVEPIFGDMINETGPVLIVNPSPDFIMRWSHDHSNIQTEIAVADQTVANLYQSEFQFLSVHTLQQNPRKQFRYILLLCRDIDPETILHELNYATPNAEVLALLPETSITGKDAAALRSDLEIRQIIQIPSDLSQSSPRKKILVWTRKTSNQDLQSIHLLHCKNINSYALQIKKSYSELPYRCLGTGKTLVQLQRLLSTGFLPQKRILKEASIYMFSSEIAIHYTIKTKGDYFCGKACYRQKIPSDSSRKLGSRLTPFLEKGLRVKSMDLMEPRLDQLILADTNGIWKIIAEDILEFYQNSLDPVSLKTIWICTRHILLTKALYQETLCIQMFCGESQDLSDLRLCTATDADYTRSMSSVVGNENVSRFWKQLSLILQTACQAGYLLNNPIASVAKSQAEQERNRIQEVRNALTKRFLTRIEMQNLLSFATTPENSTSLPLCISKSLYLIPIIRLFTGMTNREVCALTWKKFIHVPELNMYQLVVSHSMADDGRLIHVLDDHPNRLRCIPLIPQLAQLLTARMDYLCSKRHLDRTDLLDMPIILAKESGNMRTYPLSSAAKVCRNAINAALKDLLPNIITLPNSDGNRSIDLSTYYGDIYATNLRYYARHVSKLTPGELTYLLGIAPADTYSAHYADYSDSLFQRIIQLKLQRWAEPLMLDDTSQLTAIPSKSEMDYMLSPDSDGVLSSQMTLQSLPGHTLDNTVIHLDCSHGLSGTITCI